jgi:SAM-dependent methyltransferase
LNSAQFIDQNACYLCGSESRSVERELGTEEGQLFLRWVRCKDCELVYLDPRPSMHALSVLYDSQGYWQGEDGYQDYVAEGTWRRKQARDRARWFAKQLKKRHPRKDLKVLEVGSAAGYFLQELTEAGVRAQGLDISRPMVRLAGTGPNQAVSVTQGQVEESEFPAQSFEGLVAWGCDSNFNDPLNAFKKFSEWLRPGGLLAFNFHEHDHWASYLKGRFKQMPNALYFLNSKHVKLILNEFGLELLEQRVEKCWMNLATLYHHTGHRWLVPTSQGPLARLPIKLPVPGAYRVLARKKT